MADQAIEIRANWQQLLTGAISDPLELCRLLDLDLKTLPPGHPLLSKFPVRVPGPFLSRIERGNPTDPLLLQVLPATAEADTVPGFTNDPLEETDYSPAPGILCKYDGRALLLVTSSCAIHCRYCFRRHFPYSDNRLGKQQWQKSLAWIEENTNITEIIFSGGDPLTLPDDYLEWFLETLAGFSHVERIRIHTRLPIMIPQRVTRSLCRILANPRFRTILVLHSNHAQEFDEHVDSVCAMLKQSNVVLLNQSVLLKGINNSCDALSDLSERMFAAGVLPYYLHMPDKVAGSTHFYVDEHEALTLVRQLQAGLPGYLVPRLVQEVPGEASKTLITGV